MSPYADDATEDGDAWAAHADEAGAIHCDGANAM